MHAASGGHVRFEKIRNKSQLFMVSSAVSFHWLDLLMDFYCRNRCWIRKEVCGFYIRLPWLKCDVIVWDSAKKWAPAHFFFYFRYFLYIWKYCNHTQLRQIARNQSLEKDIKKYIKRYPDPDPDPGPGPGPRPRVLLTPLSLRLLKHISVFVMLSHLSIS